MSATLFVLTVKWTHHFLLLVLFFRFHEPRRWLAGSLSLSIPICMCLQCIQQQQQRQQRQRFMQQFFFHSHKRDIYIIASWLYGFACYFTIASYPFHVLNGVCSR